eukprot:CAMPEP_0117496036 /NCGR_PEP_ID=MMETSP0784-20121206/20447_1 /TAXON_ID=39447 /ORGANISM="" /LENGTH=611 /DNA_ID=CAMNT_0005290989 /DNA_START=286 /DNA_END=2121 /DNA_ORIENTATION=-
MPEEAQSVGPWESQGGPGAARRPETGDQGDDVWSKFFSHDQAIVRALKDAFADDGDLSSMARNFTWEFAVELVLILVFSKVIRGALAMCASSGGAQKVKALKHVCGATDCETSSEDSAGMSLFGHSQASFAGKSCKHMDARRIAQQTSDGVEESREPKETRLLQQLLSHPHPLYGSKSASDAFQANPRMPGTSSLPTIQRIGLRFRTSTADQANATVVPQASNMHGSSRDVGDRSGEPATSRRVADDQILPPSRQGAGQHVGRDPVKGLTAQIRNCARNSQWKQALRLLDEFPKHNATPDAVAFGTAVGACSKAKQWVEALDLLSSMLKQGQVPDMVCYNSAVTACEKGHAWKEALRLLDDMPRRGATPGIITFSAAISASEKGNQWEEALRLFGELPQRGLKPGVITYSATISACGNAGQWCKALKVLRQMQHEGVAPNTITLNAAISACGKGQQWREALRVLREEMPEHGVAPNVISYSAAITACDKGQQWVEALKLLGEMEDQGVLPNVVTYSATISALSKGKVWSTALQLLHAMPTQGLTPNVVTFSAAIGACERGNHWRGALEVLREMRTYGVTPNAVSYTLAIKACRRARQMSEVSHLTALLSEL